MRPITSGPWVTGLLVAACALATDQTTKVIASHGQPGLFPARNPAYAFGIVGGSAPVLVIVALLVLGAFVGVASLLVTRLGISAAMPALIAGGTVGNTLDRMRLGSVRDFVVTPWAIVNLADVAVAIGVVGIALALAARVPRLRAEFATR